MLPHLMTVPYPANPVTSSSLLMNLEIRPATLADAIQIARFGTRVFHGFNQTYVAEEDLARYAADSFSVLHLMDELEAGRTRYFQALANGVLCGIARLHPTPTPPVETGGPAAEVSHFYVDHAWTGRGIGRGLMQALLEAADDEGYETLWLRALTANQQTRRFYERWGFEPVLHDDYRIGRTFQPTILMARTA